MPTRGRTIAPSFSDDDEPQNASHQKRLGGVCSFSTRRYITIRMVGISLIVPAFNAAATLNATIQSIVRQIYPDWEAIIVDDGSIDFTNSNAQVWCERDSRFHLIKTPNRGVSAARNEGARYATAPWLLFV